MNENFFAGTPTFKLGFPTQASILENRLNSADRLEINDTLMPLADPPFRKSWNSGTGSSSVNRNLEKYLSKNRPPSIAYSVGSQESREINRSRENSGSGAIHFEV